MSESSQSDLSAPIGWRSVAVFLATLAVTGMLWWIQERSHHERLRIETSVTAEQVARRLSDWLADRMSISAHLAEKWEAEFQGDVGRFERDAARFTRRFPGFQAINWIDPVGVIRIVVPRETNESALNVDLNQHPSPHVRDALARALRDRGLTRTPALIQLLQGGRGFATYRPIFAEDGSHLGFINAVFRMQELIDTCLGRLRVNERFHFAIRENTGELVYPQGAAHDHITGGYTAVELFPVAGLNWSLVVAPSPESIQAHRLAAHHLILPAGLLVGLILAAFDSILVRRKRALESSQNQFRSLFEQAPLAYFSAYPDARIQRANHVASVLTGREAGDLEGMSFFNLLPEKGPARTTARSLFEAVSRGASVRGEELTMRRASGDEIVVQIHMDGLSGASGEFSMLRIAVIDSTERKEAEGARARLSSAIDQAEEGVIIAAPDGRIVYVNPAARAMGPESSGEVAGRPLLAFLRDRVASAESLEEIDRAIHEGRSWRGPCPVHRPDGRTSQAMATLSAVRGGNGEISDFVLIHRDTSFEAELQAQLQQSRRLEAIGRLAAGIAHDFNNILQSLLGYATLARRNPGAVDEVALALDEIERAGLRAAELVSQILTFGRQSIIERKAVKLRSVVEEVASLVRGTMPASIALSVDFEEPEYLVRADTTQIHQVIMNLVSNALHALRDGGRLSVAYGPVELNGRDAARWPSLEPGRYMRLEVQDTGSGMDNTILERIFEPYFSTRDIGTGTGLGLATVHGIVENHGGAIAVESAPGKGARFTILFPALSEEATPGEPCDGPRDDAVDLDRQDAPRTRVLYVDDEPTIVDSMRRVLQRFGFDVAGFTSSRAALEAFRAEPESFGILVTDLTMPDLNGMALAEAIIAIRPGFPVILCSGYGDSIDESAIGAAGPIQLFMKKPVSARALSAEIRRLTEPSHRGSEGRW